MAACRDRHETLASVFPTWLSIPDVDEIVLIDWSSDPPLQTVVHPEDEPRLKLFRVNNEKSWVLSRAYNLAMNKTKKDYVIRTDCDYALNGTVLQAHNLTATQMGFYSGNWMLARDENEVHLNGAMIMRRDVFWSVGGYDERIQTYGWDDEDLYTRLTANNVEKLNISYDHVRHVSHGDGSRAQRGVKFAQVQIDLNQLLLEKLPPWSKGMLDAGGSSVYKAVKDHGAGYKELEATYVPSSLKGRVGASEYGESWALALGRRLADDFRVPWDILTDMDSPNKERLLRSLMSLQNDLDEGVEGGGKKDERLKPPKHARILFVHCMHGLGNRLRALGSALAFARNAKRVPVIIWEGDAHIAADLGALFDISGFIVMTKFSQAWPFSEVHKYDQSWLHFDFYNYMEMEDGAKKGELIVNDPSKHLYYKGAYVMEAPDFSWWEADNEELRKLKPVKMVQNHLDELEKQKLSSAIGVHIRNRTLAADIANVDFVEEYGSEAVATMEHWRSQSSYLAFVAEMKRIMKDDDPNARFYIASDTYEVIAIMEKKFPGKILSTKRSCDDRDSNCVKYAVIDMYALSRTKQLLGSNWSSYTELVERLGGLKARLAGQDFGGPSQKEQSNSLGKIDMQKSEEELQADDRDRKLDSRRE